MLELQLTVMITPNLMYHTIIHIIFVCKYFMLESFMKQYFEMRSIFTLCKVLLVNNICVIKVCRFCVTKYFLPMKTSQITVIKLYDSLKLIVS